jgi:hypothetical protein
MKANLKEPDDLEFVCSGLAKISGRGRKYLKDAARTLLCVQKTPGFMLPGRGKCPKKTIY